MIATLRATSPEAPAWTWYPKDRRVLHVAWRRDCRHRVTSAGGGHHPTLDSDWLPMGSRSLEVFRKDRRTPVSRRRPASSPHGRRVGVALVPDGARYALPINRRALLRPWLLHALLRYRGDAYHNLASTVMKLSCRLGSVTRVLCAVALGCVLQSPPADGLQTACQVVGTDAITGQQRTHCGLDAHRPDA